MLDRGEGKGKGKGNEEQGKKMLILYVVLRHVMMNIMYEEDTKD